MAQDNSNKQQTILMNAVFVICTSDPNKPYSGSAYLVADCYLVTCAHLVEGPGGAVTLKEATSRTLLIATVVHYDKGNDIAVLKLDKPHKAEPLPLSATLPTPQARLDCYGWFSENSPGQ